MHHSSKTDMAKCTLSMFWQDIVSVDSNEDSPTSYVCKRRHTSSGCGQPVSPFRICSSVTLRKDKCSASHFLLDLTSHNFVHTQAKCNKYLVRSNKLCLFLSSLFYLNRILNQVLDVALRRKHPVLR